MLGASLNGSEYVFVAREDMFRGVCFDLPLAFPGVVGCYMSPKTAWFTALAFAATKRLRSSTVISLSWFSVMSLATSRHLCWRPYGSLPTIALRVSGFSTLFRYPISFREFLTQTRAQAAALPKLRHFNEIFSIIFINLILLATQRSS